jgi:hypothetical protein
VNTVRGIGKIFESLSDVDDILEWINLYALIYHDANIVNNVDDIIFEKRYLIFIERAARETVTKKSKKLKKRKKRNRIF